MRSSSRLPGRLLDLLLELRDLGVEPGEPGRDFLAREAAGGELHDAYALARLHRPSNDGGALAFEDVDAALDERHHAVALQPHVVETRLELEAGPVAEVALLLVHHLTVLDD